jgi:hypothetical protein
VCEIAHHEGADARRNCVECGGDSDLADSKFRKPSIG